MIAEGACDMVVMARALIADPELPVKAFRGEVEDIRFCVGVQDGCWRRFEAGLGISCAQNPTVGQEAIWGGPPPKAQRARRVVVVGGGPAGLEAARVAALRGHQVTVLERGRRLGGQIRIAERAPQRAELGQIADWLEGQCAKGGVEIRLGVEATPESVLALEPDVAIVATGARPGRLAEAGSAGLDVVDAWSVLEGQPVAGRQVLVFDELGTRPGFSAAELLAERGCQVELITPLVYPGQGLDGNSWRIAYGRLIDLGVRFQPLTTLSRIGADGVVVRHVFSGREQTLTGLTTVVTASLPVAEDGLHRALRERLAACFLIGDAAAPRGIYEAFYDGQKLAREIE
jgi:NADPH-dependent 2,4-dienoyl-CoA reductase/sulfur reductase-like enzyme